MMNRYENKLFMYYEIHRLHREGMSISQIARYIVADWRTVKKYLLMDEREHEAYLNSLEKRKKELSDYEIFVKEKLIQYPDTPAAQMHDWLKECYPDFPKVNPKTIYNFVMHVRQEYNIPKVSPAREYFIVEELPKGKQAQVDFGEYNMRCTDGKRKKVYFFTMVLSYSRFKYVCFTDCPFTSELAINAHEKAFKFFDGIPNEIVYDQDKVFMNNENHGDLILVERFQSYVTQQRFAIYFCRKADPETKGKVENVVKYVKQNFLYNRIYYDLDTLNAETLAWLGRTANQMPHGTIKQVPYDLWMEERSKLAPYVPVSLLLDPEYILYTVRPDNSISYKSCFYSLPQGTYRKPYTNVIVNEDNGFVIICNLDNKEICRHKRSTIVGKKVINTDHKRDKSKRIKELINDLAKCFENPSDASLYLQEIKMQKPRYIRDQIILIKDAFEKYGSNTMNQTLSYCKDNQIYSATDFIAVADNIENKIKQKLKVHLPEIKTLPESVSKLASLKPFSSNIDDYQDIILN